VNSPCQEVISHSTTALPYTMFRSSSLLLAAVALCVWWCPSSAKCPIGCVPYLRVVGALDKVLIKVTTIDEMMSVSFTEVDNMMEHTCIVKSEAFEAETILEQMKIKLKKCKRWALVRKVKALENQVTNWRENTEQIVSGVEPNSTAYAASASSAEKLRFNVKRSREAVYQQLTRCYLTQPNAYCKARDRLATAAHKCALHADSHSRELIDADIKRAFIHLDVMTILKKIHEHKKLYRWLEEVQSHNRLTYANSMVQIHNKCNDIDSASREVGGIIPHCEFDTTHKHRR